MELFVNTQRTTDKEKERLFFAGVLFLLGKAYSDAYSCFDRIQEEHFAVMYNKALCCFMVKWYDECYRLRGGTAPAWNGYCMRNAVA